MSVSRWVIALSLLALVLGFQNCSETLPGQAEQAQSSTSLTIAPTPGPAPAPGPTAPNPTPNPGPSPTPAPAPPVVSLVNSSASPGIVLPGASVAMNLRLASDKTATGTLRLSVKNSNKTVVWTQSYANQSVSAAQATDVLKSYLSADTLAVGTYTLGVEVLSSDLSQTWLSAPAATTFEVRPPIRVSAGRTTPYTDSLGQVWAAASGFTGVSIGATENFSVEGTNDPVLMNSFRYGYDNVNFVCTPFTFTANVPSAGNYKVRLRWVEHYVTGPDQRIFNVVLNGVAVLTNFDLFVNAGGMFKHYERIFTTAVPASDLRVQINFNVGRIQCPEINAIEILGAN